MRRLPVARETPRSTLPSPLLAPDGPPSARRVRILRGIVKDVTRFLVMTAAAPLILLLAGAVDLARWLRSRKPWMSVRLVALVWWFYLGELNGLAGVIGVWVISGGPLGRDTPARRRRTYRLQVRWATGHLAGLCRLCRVRFEIEGDELVGPGPIIVFTRHASIVDNGLPARVVSQAHGIDLRYALKSELQSLPTLDLGARWVPTCFVNRGSADPEREVARVRTLACSLSGPRDGVLVYPEGTRYTPAKLAKLKQRTDLKDPSLTALIAELHHVLPPRLGGPLALLDEAPHAAVVICGHVGLDRFHDLREIWSGELVGTTVRVRFWRYEPDEIPSGRDARSAWLYDRWRELDEWVARNRSATREHAMAVRGDV